MSEEYGNLANLVANSQDNKSRSATTRERPVSGGEVASKGATPSPDVPPTPVISPLVRAFRTFYEVEPENRAIARLSNVP